MNKFILWIGLIFLSYNFICVGGKIEINSEFLLCEPTNKLIDFTENCHGHTDSLNEVKCQLMKIKTEIITKISIYEDTFNLINVRGKDEVFYVAKGKVMLCYRFAKI